MVGRSQFWVPAIPGTFPIPFIGLPALIVHFPPAALRISETFDPTTLMKFADIRRLLDAYPDAGIPESLFQQLFAHCLQCHRIITCRTKEFHICPIEPVACDDRDPESSDFDCDILLLNLESLMLMVKVLGSLKRAFSSSL